jgi:hypothetical protein
MVRIILWDADSKSLSGRRWSWSYGSWIYNYLCNQCLSPLMWSITIELPQWWGRGLGFCDNISSLNILKNVWRLFLCILRKHKLRINFPHSSTYSVVVYLPSTSQVNCILHYAKEFFSDLLKVSNFSPYYLNYFCAF